MKRPREVGRNCEICLSALCNLRRTGEKWLTGSGDMNCVISDIAPKFWFGFGLVFPCNRGHGEPSPVFVRGGGGDETPT